MMAGADQVPPWCVSPLRAIGFPPGHQNEAAFYNRIRLIRLAQETRTILHFILSVRNLVPENRCEVIEADFSATDDDIRVQWHDHVPPMPLTGKANVSNNTNQPSARHQNAQTVTPNLF